MTCHQICLLLASIASIASAIRVDWNTNTGPIIPPTSTVRPAPQQPYRQPAPVWETDENDTPNPYSYHYILPPPSRPRPATDNYVRASPAELLHLQYQAPQPTYGQFVTNHPNSLQHSVPTLAVQYIPNKGPKYFALAPASGKAYYSKDADSFDKYNKLNGKYNAKLKKHKAYEKVKHVNYNKYISPKYEQQQFQSIYTSTQQPQYQPHQNPPQINYDSPITKRDIFFRPQTIWG